jgi:deoxyribodipyrimidine photo-lyase
LVNKVNISCLEVESNVVVPAKVASTKEEYSASTFRPKVMKILPQFLDKSATHEPKKSSLGLIDDNTDLTNINPIIRNLRIPHNVLPVASFKGGESEAHRVLGDFVSNNLERYSQYKNDPAAYCVSGLSPYLHFGQISPVTIAQKVMESRPDKADRFLEELIVRRELAVNYVYNNTLYDDYDGLPEWARRSLTENILAPKEYTYERDKLEAFQTHDEFWNAAQKELVSTGKMHGYLRMYWGKKVIEWSKTPREAFGNCIYLNNKYALDGRDPNSYAGIAWCFGKHDRPFPTRPIFGNVRYMSSDGLRRKFDMKEYLRRMQ